MRDYLKLRLWDSNLKIRLAGETIFNLFYWMYFPFMAVYFSHALGNQMAGILMTIPPLMILLSNMIGGGLADSMGRRKVMLIGSILRTTMFALFALSSSSSPWLSYLAFIGIGLGGGLYGPASDAMVADLVPEKERRKVFATFITANNMGAVLGPAIGAFFFFHYRNELLWTCAIIMLLFSMTIYFKVHESLPEEFQAKSNSSSIKSQWHGYKLILCDKIFILYLLGGIFSVIAIMQLDLYLAIYITKHVPSQSLLAWTDWPIMLSSTDILGWILGLNGLLFVLFVVPVTSWLKNWTDRNVFILSAILAGFGMFLVGFTSNIWLLFLLTIIFTFGEIVRSPVLNNFISDYAPPAARGQYMGASRLQFTIGRFIAPVTVFFSEWVQPIGIFSIILICALSGGAFYILLYKMHTIQPKNMDGS